MDVQCPESYVVPWWRVMDLSVYDPCVDGADDGRKSRRGGITLWIERVESARCRIISSRWPEGVNVSVPVLL